MASGYRPPRTIRGSRRVEPAPHGYSRRSGPVCERGPGMDGDLRFSMATTMMTERASSSGRRRAACCSPGCEQIVGVIAGRGRGVRPRRPDDHDEIVIARRRLLEPIDLFLDRLIVARDALVDVDVPAAVEGRDG